MQQDNFKTYKMGKLKNGINGGFSGKVGTVVGVNLRGKDVIRSLPKPTNKVSPAQERQRQILSLVSRWLKPLRELIEIGYQLFSKDKSAMNAAISDTMKIAVKEVDGVKQIDYPKAVFSRGELFLSWILEILTLINAVIHIKWDNAAPSAFNKATDKATLIVYNPVMEQFAFFEDVAERGEKEAIVQLPAEFAGDQVHCWMHFVSAEGNKVSTTHYLGEMAVV